MAIIAGLAKSSFYHWIHCIRQNVRKNVENVVLSRMLDENQDHQAEYDAAIKEPM